jgi:hypothetical protein
MNDQLANLYRDSQRELFAENEQLKRDNAALIGAIHQAHAALCEANTSRGDLRAANAAAESILWYAIRKCQPSPS